MKVAFIFGGLPHYLIKLLNKINENQDIEVISISPIASGKTIGNGVHLVNDGNNFKSIKLNEFDKWYTKPFFKNFILNLKQKYINDSCCNFCI